jgi:AraC-like DNA-binding protein
MTKGIFSAPSLEVPQSPVHDRERDYAMLRSSVDSPMEFATVKQPYPRGMGLRFHCEDSEQLFGHSVGEGYSDFIQLSDDLCARVVNARMDVPTGVRCLGEDWLKIEVYISGRQSLVFEEVGQIDLNSRWCHVHLHPRGIVKGDWSAPGQPGTALIVYLRPGFLRERLAETIDRLPPALRAFARDGRTEFMFESLPVTSRMAAAVSDVVSTPFLGSLRRLYVESKAIEVVSGAFHALTQTEEPGNGRLRLNQRDIERLHAVRGIIERDFADPPPIVELARRAGLNQQKLKCGFKLLFGMTVFECYQGKRLAVAADLLETQGASVTEAALAAGYEYPSNFAIAFKRRYGVQPKQLRKRLG